ncbi:RNA polymerase alpha subunit C-terminal domain-containing protein [Niabella drilacis]|uniref:RNA polymerase, alpha chain C terminal domain n=1 Tax=Niabella drilacis (strain DSM 25811 / CCM 8410 / CCUG 62505 / LMG 26954 / E90) TaxID=1285928 RepID=A0A1G6T6L9_NIADE|nr:RNA polymerase alpha subunit C-terminal domain-containing protein [Niabella drilacis]SDD24603.1 hypothetical protein SAMN04487894_107112 [Niabella drilacis]
MSKGTFRVCAKGHKYYKSSDCPSCPVCEQERKPQTGFLSLLGAPARRALEGAGISSVEALAQHSEAAIMKLHGMGPASLPVLKMALEASGLTFKD